MLLSCPEVPEGQESAAFPLVRRIGLEEPKADLQTGWVIQTDASPVGAGAILMHRGMIIAYMHHAWKQGDFPPQAIRTHQGWAGVMISADPSGVIWRVRAFRNSPSHLSILVSSSPFVS